MEWDDAIGEHHRQVVEGDELGRLVSGVYLAPLESVPRDHWKVLVDEGMAVPSVSPYTQPKNNPKEFQG